MSDQPLVHADITELVKDLSEVSDLSPDEITKNILEDIGALAVAKAKEKAPVDTGALRQSIDYKVRGATLEIVAGVPYAMYQELGTGTRGEFPGEEYVIKPKTAKVLAFEVGGQKVFARQVRHPGVAAQPYLRPGAKEAIDELVPRLAEMGKVKILRGPNAKPDGE